MTLELSPVVHIEENGPGTWTFLSIDCIVLPGFRVEPGGCHGNVLGIFPLAGFLVFVEKAEQHVQVRQLTPFAKSVPDLERFGFALLSRWDSPDRIILPEAFEVGIGFCHVKA